MRKGTVWDRVRENISRAYEWLTRMFLRCDGNRCSAGLALFEMDDEGLFPVHVMVNKERELIYVYFCPWCGRPLSKTGQRYLLTVVLGVAALWLVRSKKGKS